MMPETNTTKAAFNPVELKEQLESALPDLITEIYDLFERPAPRLNKRDRQRMSEELFWCIDVFAQYVDKLEDIRGDTRLLPEGFKILEQMLRKYLQRANLRFRRDDDAFGHLVKEMENLLRAPYRLKRLKQFRMTREGVQTLVRTAMAAPGGLKASQDLIEKAGRKHGKEYLRFANSVDARLNSYRNIDFRTVTARNITRVSDLYRDIASAFENRLRLLVGLNYIAVGKARTYAELRSFSYNQLLQAVESPNNPLLHFLTGTVNRHVRNALSHAGVSSRLSKQSVVFIDYAPHKKKETEIIWTMPKFIRETKKLLLTILGAAYLENEFMYGRTYCVVAAMKDMLSSQSSSVNCRS